MSGFPARPFDGDDFGFFNRAAFKDWSTKDTFPRWLRVTFSAYATHQANGHATYGQGELAAVLGDEVDGVWLPAARQRVREAIDLAIGKGTLMPDSKALCLIVPPAAVAYRMGNPHAPCRRHAARKERQNRVVRGQKERFDPVVSPTKERSDRVVSRSGPSLLLLTQPTEEQEVS
ncbi:hypothetical protein [Nocardioides sp. Kera G14]|uniref:hypothetical protein n=1 Tax=Nocardioides sp. Kera G14 TaxID=2884264 RepID=UPI001D123479|nr:hypothetical protein [Nocardioides sp. Kera G14]UDY22397.1 hypothetical protein LH076_09925 [Nocardioides sp. Kera G14]